MFAVITALTAVAALAFSAPTAPSSHHCIFHGVVHKLGDKFADPNSCNTCTCDSYGVSCTEIWCPTGKRDAVLPGVCHYGGRVYKAGEGFRSTDGCNGCGCSKEGFVICTELACLGPIADGSPVEREVVRPGTCTIGGQVHQAGERFKSTDGCNECWCSENGYALCTKMACMPNKSIVKSKRAAVHPGACDYGGRIYKAGDHFKSTDGCNTCGCSEDGFAYCTEMACFHGPFVDGHVGERDVLRPGECHYGGRVYKAGEGFKSTDGCNSCGCSESGFVMCTLGACVQIS